MGESIHLALISIGGAVISSILTYLLSRRKYMKETDSIEFQNNERLMASYRIELESMTKRLTDYIQAADEERAKFISRIKVLEDKVDLLTEENKALRKDK